MSDDERIRRIAYRIWQDEGHPAGREAIHWKMACELVTIEDEQKTTAAKSVRRSEAEPDEVAETAEPAAPTGRGRALPNKTDENEQAYPPSRDVETSRTSPIASESRKRPGGRHPGSGSPRPGGKRKAEKPKK